MSPDRFEHFLPLGTPLIPKQITRFRKLISAEQRLVVTLRHLALVKHQFWLSNQKSYGDRNPCRNIRSYNPNFKRPAFKNPTCQKEWLSISKIFKDKWNSPHCLGILDGKQNCLECPKLSGTYCYNYKGFYSIVLSEICDSNYCLTLFDLGQYRRNIDCSVLADSEMGKILKNDKSSILSTCKLSSCSFDPLPHFCWGRYFPVEKLANEASTRKT